MSRLLAVFITLTLGCETAESADVEDAGVDAGDEACSCTAIEDRLLAEISANSPCTADQDCQAATLPCLLTDRPTCSDAYYFNLDADLAQIKSDSAALDACVATCDPARHCGGCLMGYPPVCHNGTCAPSVQ